LELGLRHEEQISLLEGAKIQYWLHNLNSLTLATSIVQSVARSFIEFAQSKFHAVFTDHKVGIQNTSAKIQGVWLAKYTHHDFCQAPLSIQI